MDVELNRGDKENTIHEAVGEKESRFYFVGLIASACPGSGFTSILTETTRKVVFL